MKYRLYKGWSTTGFIVDEYNILIIDFWWPGSELFLLHGIDWAVNKNNIQHKQIENSQNELMIEANSIEECKQWLVENYFDYFL